MMTSSDIKFVITKVMQPLETNDPYSADYYYLQKNYKKNVSVREEAMSTGAPVPAPIYLPFPAWMDTKNRIAMQLEENRKVVTERSRQWEEKEQVLGHMQRTDISRPKELLSVPNWQDIQDMQDNDLDGMDGSSFRMPFVRCVYTLSEYSLSLHYHSDMPVIKHPLRTLPHPISVHDIPSDETWICPSATAIHNKHPFTLRCFAYPYPFSVACGT